MERSGDEDLGSVSYHQQEKPRLDEMALEGTERWSLGRDAPRGCLRKTLGWAWGTLVARVIEWVLVSVGGGRCGQCSPV